MNTIPFLIEVPAEEKDEFKQLIHKYRGQYIRSSQELVEIALQDKADYSSLIQQKNVS